MANVYEQVVLCPNACVVYKDYSEIKKKDKVMNANSLKNLAIGKKGNYNGYMSPSTARKCKKYISSWLLSLKHGKGNKRKTTFVTLTLPAVQVHNDNEIKRKMLDYFIKIAVRKWNVKHYFWRAEPQKNGNIHFHIIFDSMIDWKLIRGNWNRIMKRFGYIDAYRKKQLEFHKNGFVLNTAITQHKSRIHFYKKQLRQKKTNKSFADWDKEKQLEAYNYGIKSNWENPNSTDIHITKGVRNITSYICKYMTKSELNGRVIKGRIWGCSDGLRKLKYPVEQLSMSDFDSTSINWVMDSYLNELINLPKTKVLHEDFIDVIILSNSQEKLLRKYCPLVHQSYTYHYQKQYSQLY